MQKKKNNPWYYYLNSELVKKRKPAMPGQAVLIKEFIVSIETYQYAIKYSTVVVHEVFMGGFHDVHRKYYLWSEIQNPNDIDVKFDNLHEEIDFAWKQVEESHIEVEKLKKKIKDLQEINGWLLNRYTTTK